MTTSQLSKTITDALGRYSDCLEAEGIAIDQGFLEELGQSLFCQALACGLDRAAASKLARSAAGLEPPLTSSSGLSGAAGAF